MTGRWWLEPWNLMTFHILGIDLPQLTNSIIFQREMKMIQSLLVSIQESIGLCRKMLGKVCKTHSIDSNTIQWIVFGKKTKSTGPTRFYVILRDKQSFRLSGSLKPIHWVVSMSPGFGLGWARNTSWTTLAGAPWSPWCRSPTLGCWPTKDGEQWTVG